MKRRRPAEEDAGPGAEGEQAPFASTVVGLAPPSEFEAAMQEAMFAICEVVKHSFGDEAVVVPFGSLVQGAHLDGSDLDLGIGVPDGRGSHVEGGGTSNNSEQVTILRRLMNKFPPSFRVIETRFWKHIKVPIIILGFRSSSGREIEADVSVGIEFEGVAKGITDRLIRKALMNAPRILHAVRLVKLWAKVEQVNKAYEGYLNSLGWSLAVLHFFMLRGEFSSDLFSAEDVPGAPDSDGTLLPPLHDTDADSLDALVFDVPLPEEVAECFEWVAGMASSWPEEDPPGGVWALSLVDGDMIEVPPAGGKSYPDQSRFFIEDPGVRVIKGSHDNVGRSLKTGSWSRTLQVCQAAADAIRDDADAWARSVVERAAAGAGEAAAAVGKGVGKGGKGQRPTHLVPGAKRGRPMPNLVPRITRPRLGAPPQAGGAQLAARQQETCAWWLKGECWSGDRCKYSHG